MDPTINQPTTKFFVEQLEHMEKAVVRELKFRNYVYPKRVADEKMTQKKADNEILLMEKILELIQEQKQTARKMTPGLFD